MDPNDTLKRLRLMAQDIMAGEHVEEQAPEFAELFESLDEWIAVKHGFLPSDWEPQEISTTPPSGKGTEDSDGTKHSHDAGDVGPCCWCSNSGTCCWCSNSGTWLLIHSS